MRGRLTIALLATALVALAIAPAARADFGLHGIEVTFSEPDGSPAAPIQAGAHPFSMDTELEVNTVKEGSGEELEFVNGAFRQLEVIAPEGFAADPNAVDPCSTLDFLTKPEGAFEVPNCADGTVVGTVEVTVGNNGKRPEGGEETTPLYNLEPPPGAVAKLGFWASDTPVTVLVGLTSERPYRGRAVLSNAVQVLEIFGSSLSLWGTPADKDHDAERGRCLRKGGLCSADITERPFLTLPRRCGAIETVFRATPWWTGSPFSPSPGGAPFAETVATPPGLEGCEKIGFSPEISTQPTTESASSPAGLDVALEVKDEGLTNPVGIATRSDIKKAVVKLPEGMTANPSLAEGLATCSEADLERETLHSLPGEGCPQAAKIGTLEVETPILAGKVFRGQVFVATQNENPFNALIALYMVVKDPGLGVLLKLAGKVEPDPETGQLTTTFGEPGHEIPQFPVSNFRFRFREGSRSPLITPERCGEFTTEAFFTPWANPASVLRKTSTFEITRGVGGGPCPAAGAPPFVPGFSAGSLNNSAGAYSPFHMRLTRRDGDQDLTRFSAVLPRGMIARLAGTTQCPEASIAAARARSGRAELAAPSCPPSSRLGAIIGGAGAGSQLTYVPGSFYLAGPLRGAPLSAVAIVPAVAGPFDVGTVVVRQALRVNPRSGEVRVDSEASDALPTTLAGIPLKVRDVRVEVDRPQFTINPTNCTPSTIAAQIWGSGLLPRDPGDDAPVTLLERFQASNCASLGFKPELSLRLKGGTRRGDFPALRTVYTPRPGDANISDLVLRLPRSAFLEQGHFRTICTRVQYAADACPAGAIYGHARAFTPILDQPLEGPLYLRSSDHKLPDLVFDLHGLVDVEAVARVDSHKGGIRATVEDVPDAPVSKIVVTMQGGQKGLIVNSRNLCAKKSRAAVELTAQNGKQRNLRALVKAVNCKKAKKPKRRGKSGR